MSALVNALLYADNTSDSKDDTSFVLSSCRSLLTWSTEERVLDVGCGPGDVTATVVRSHLPSKSVLVGGDISKEMIKFAKSKYEDELTHFKEIDVASENLFSLWNGNEFTKVVSFYTLHRVRNLKQALRNIYDLLKPGGQVVLQFITNDHPGGRLHQELVKLEEYAKYREIVDDVYHFLSFTDPVGHVRDLLISVDFEAIQVLREPRVHKYKSMDSFMDSFTSFSPLVHKMPPEDFRKAMADARKLVETGQTIVSVTDEGKPISNYSIVVAVARKAK